MDVDVVVTIRVTNAKNAKSALASVVRGLYSGRSHFNSATIHQDAIADRGQYIITAYFKDLEDKDTQKAKAARLTFQGHKGD